MIANRSTRSVLPRAALLLALFAAAFLLAACSLASEPVPAGPIETGPLPGETVELDAPVSLPRAAQGELVYLENCARCHAADGTADSELAAELTEQGASLPDFTDEGFVHTRSPLTWYQIITNGNMQAFMPPWKDSLSDSQRWNVAYYLYTFTSTPEDIEGGRAIYEDVFASELGPQGEGVGLDSLAAVSALSQQDIVDQFLDGAGTDVAQEDLWNVAAYMQTFGYDPSLEMVAEEPAETEAAAEAAVATDEPAEGEATEEPAEEATEEPPAEEATEDAPAEEPVATTGLVEGKVEPSSAGLELPDTLEVTLRGVAVDENNQVFEFLVQSQPVGEDGSFRFEDVPFDTPRSAYVVEVIQNGVTFSNGQIINPANPTINLPLPVYATTTDPSVVSVDAMHMLVRTHPDALLVTQVYVYSNSSDSIYVTEEPVSGGRRGSVAVSIPEDAYGLTFEEGQLGGRFVQVGDVVYDTEQLYPGSQSQAVIVNYFVPYDGPREIELPIAYDTAQLNLLVEDGQRVRSDAITEAGSEVIEQLPYDKYLAQALAAGDSVTLRIQPEANRNLLPTIGFVLAGVLIVAGVAFWFVQRRALAPAPAAAGYSSEEAALAAEIAELDEAFEAGRINRFDYEARRAALKAEMAALLEDEIE